MDSTPPAMNTSPSPAPIAWAAPFTAWSPEPHSRLTVWHGVHVRVHQPGKQRATRAVEHPGGDARRPARRFDRPHAAPGDDHVHARTARPPTHVTQQQVGVHRHGQDATNGPTNVPGRVAESWRRTVSPVVQGMVSEDVSPGGVVTTCVGTQPVEPNDPTEPGVSVR